MLSGLIPPQCGQTLEVPPLSDLPRSGATECGERPRMIACYLPYIDRETFKSNE